MMKTIPALALALTLAIPFVAKSPTEVAAAPKKPDKGPYASSTYSGLTLRSIGPAVKGGRISDLAVDPGNSARYFVAAASGGVWKTENAGTTFEPVFDGEGSYSIGCVTLDPRNPFVVWVGTGENNSQRSVGYGDGIYRSLDGGKSWENMGLKSSEHIGKILIDPRDSNIVFAACQGPLWNPGGDRGLFRTLDGGKSWKAVLTISEDTGVTDVVLDPRNPDVLLASSYQRRRRQWGLVHGGPENALYKSTDGGESWRKVTTGLPKKAELGRIGLAMAPSNPDTLYAIVEAQGKEGGLFRSQDRGETWEKRGDFVPGSAQYYNEIFVDPKNAERFFLADTWLRISEDGGKTIRKVGERSKHVDNHAVWIDPADTRHLLVGCDGGLYETWDRGATWDFKPNLPLAQFYRVAVDASEPVYFVYGGTQDNNTLGGPSRTMTRHGILNSDWFVTVGGDGFQTRVDPKDPNIVYSQYQHGGLSRFDRATGERVDIQPQPGPGEEPLRFNWDSPLVISAYNPHRLYFACHKIFQSDDRGDTWRAISGDLSRQMDRNKLPIMGRVWSADGVAKNASTSFYGAVVALAESPLQAGLLFAGTDDGLLHITEDGGVTWRKIASFPGVPERTFFSRLEASRHSPKTVFAAFDNHKAGDFKPYLLKTTDLGKSWTSIAGDLPLRGSIYCLVEDSVEPSLLFVGTEFGLYFTRDGGLHWVQLKGGIPTIQVRDLALQLREDDLVVATFGRGFYILDDLAPLRQATPENLQEEALLFPPRLAQVFIPSSPMGLKDKADQGDSLYAAENPPFGAVFTCYLKDGLKSLKERRQEAELKLIAEKKDTPYPTWDALRAEAREESPTLFLTVRDSDGEVVRRLPVTASEGFHRVAWDLRLPAPDPVTLKDEKEFNPWGHVATGPLALPGTYSVELSQRVLGVTTSLGKAQRLEVVMLNAKALSTEQRLQSQQFNLSAHRLQRAVLGASRFLEDVSTRLDHLQRGLDETPGAALSLGEKAHSLRGQLTDLKTTLHGDEVVSDFHEPTLPGIVSRMEQIVSNVWETTSSPTATHRAQLDFSADLFDAFLPSLQSLETALRALEGEAEKAGVPWTPGRVPVWEK